MSDEIVPRRARKFEASQKKLPDINTLLTNTTKPEFLQKTDDSSFIEKEKAHPTAVNVTPHAQIQSAATISKAAEIRKIPVVKDAEEANKKYQNFVNYMELRDLAGESNEDVMAGMPPPDEEIEESTHRNRQSMYDLNKAPHDIAGGLHKNSKPIKKGERKNIIKDKEKARRMKGQSSISTWKPELFMKIRQEFD